MKEKVHICATEIDDETINFSISGNIQQIRILYSALSGKLATVIPFNKLLNDFATGVLIAADGDIDDMPPDKNDIDTEFLNDIFARFKENHNIEEEVK